jgi:hypothetical protein
MILKKYKVKQIQGYQSNKELLNCTLLEKIWFVISVPNLNTLGKRLKEDNKAGIQQQFILNKIKKYKAISGFGTNIAILMNSFKDLISFSEYLTKNELGIAQYIVYNQRVYDYSLLPIILEKKATPISNILVPKKLTHYISYPHKRVLSYLLYGVQNKTFYDNN